MSSTRSIFRVVLIAILFLISAGSILANETQINTFTSILQVQQYDRAIHIMAMLLIGFGFLMVFVRKYGRSALTATFLLVSTALPLYISIKGLGIFESKGEVEQLILAEFGAASLLIAAGAILGRVFIADIANAALAGGVAIGATCDFASHPQAMIIGVIAGVISTVGFAILQDKQQKFHKIIDTCGVSNLHGIPGIFGGLAAIVVIPGLDISAQLKGIVITVALAITAGLICGKVISLFGRTKEIYNDRAEFVDAD